MSSSQQIWQERTEDGFSKSGLSSASLRTSQTGTVWSPLDTTFTEIMGRRARTMAGNEGKFEGVCMETRIGGSQI